MRGPIFGVDSAKGFAGDNHSAGGLCEFERAVGSAWHAERDAPSVPRLLEERGRADDSTLPTQRIPSFIELTMTLQIVQLARAHLPDAARLASQPYRALRVSIEFLG